MAGSMFAQRPDPTGTPGADSLLAFESEAAPRPVRSTPLVAPARAQLTMAPAPRAPHDNTQAKLILVAAAIVAGVALAVIGVKYARARADALASPIQADGSTQPATTTGTLSVGTNPAGVLVMIDGISYGVTPLKLSLAIGDHTLVLQQNGIRHSVPIKIEAATALSQFVDLGVTPTPSTSPPLPAPVVNKASIVPAPVAAPVVPPEAIAGWVSISSPIELQIFENGRLVGTTSADRLMLPVGVHQLTLASQPYGFQTSTIVQVAAGKNAASAITLPNGSVSINALPWADVYIDGKSAGTTPLGNISVPIGSHEIVWKHPTLGERSKSVAVTLQGPVRVSIDFSK